MAAFMMKLHLEKDAQTFTMGAERLGNARNESESAAALDAYLAEHTVLREISGEETDGIANNLYIADNLWTPDIDVDLTVGFLVPRRIFLVSEDDAGCELLVWMADGEDWLPASVNYAAYGGKFFERVDTTEAMVYAMLEVYDHPGDDRYDIERHTQGCGYLAHHAQKRASRRVFPDGKKHRAQAGLPQPRRDGKGVGKDAENRLVQGDGSFGPRYGVFPFL